MERWLPISRVHKCIRWAVYLGAFLGFLLGVMFSAVLVKRW